MIYNVYQWNEVNKLLVVTTENIPNQEYETISLVIGSMIQTVNFGKDIMNSLKTLVGGELTSYTKMMEEARGIATNRMIEEAKKLNADAIVCVRYSSSQVMQGAAEVMAYGTAVRFNRKEEN